MTNVGSPVARWQILTRNPEPHAKFYCDVFGWKVNDDNAFGYRMIDTQSSAGIGGGFWPIGNEGHPMVNLYIQVEDVPAYVERATAAGAKLIIPHQKLPNRDEMAVLLDPEGIPFGVFKEAPR
jgi:predicted enzyme related to lactoylglutathione lyase